MKTEEPLKYRWQRSYDGAHKDFSAWDGDVRIGRVYHHTFGPEAVWLWYMGDDENFAFMPMKGSSPDKREACRQLEAAYIEALAKD